jgi:cytochrome c peroxidase
MGNSNKGDIMLRNSFLSTLKVTLLGSMIMFSSFGCDAADTINIVNEPSLIPSDTINDSVTDNEVLGVTTRIESSNGESELLYYENGILVESTPLLSEELYEGEILLFFSTKPDLILHDIQDMGEYKIATYRSGASSEAELIEIINMLNSTPNVIFAEPNYKNTLQKTLKSFSDNSWANEKIALIQAQAITSGDASITIAVIDTGIALTHSELRTHLWINEDEIENNGIDDDNNGFVDDIHGFDFVNNNSDISDDNAHGSHVSGISSYVASGVKIMAIKALNAQGASSNRTVFNAINYAINNHADVINLSFGGRGSSRLMRNAIRRAQRANILIVAAAGNSNRSNDNRRSETYPASFRNSNIIAVCASDINDAKADFSNFGSRSVDICAPGVDISSTVLNNVYETFSGTSMATPYVSASVALIKSLNPTMSMDEIKSTILNQSERITTLSTQTLSGARLQIASILSSIQEPEITELRLLDFAPEGDNINIDSHITLRFSSAVSLDSIGNFISLKHNGETLPFSTTIQNSTLTLTPNLLLPNTRYDVEILKDLRAQNSAILRNTINFSFTTAQEEEQPQSDLITTFPTDNAQNIDPTTSLRFEFSSHLTPAQIAVSGLTLSGNDGVAIAGRRSVRDTTLIFQPTNSLRFNAVYNVHLVNEALTIDTSLSFSTAQESDIELFTSKEALGDALFHDKSLSKFENMSCATCHEDTHAFIDNRSNRVGGALSLGSDESSFGERNAPSVNYARFTPSFRFDARRNRHSGGQFRDGRADSLTDQAKGPFLAQNEMMMDDEASVIAKVLENSKYEASFKALYNSTIFNDTQTAYTAVADAIAIFESGDDISPFDSKYDRFLQGRATLTALEEQGRALFFNPRGANCRGCHAGTRNANMRNELFTNHQYTNIGVPKNSTALIARGDSANTIDHGLLGRSDISDTRTDGFFRIPTLRNIAVTAPYMHNGVFSNLRTVIAFYNHRAGNGNGVNPETNRAWNPADVPATVENNRLRMRALSNTDINALEAFLKTLTDARYEHLLD